MEKFAVWSLATLLLGGCTESAREVEIATRNSVTDSAFAVGETRTFKPGPKAVEVTSPVDAEAALASTLERARADKKRVFVHVETAG